MSKWNASWDSDAMAEYRQLMHEACDASRNNGQRRDTVLNLLDDAIQAHRYWAADAEREIKLRGALSLVTTFARAERTVLVALDDYRIVKSADIGIRLRDSAGRSYEERALFDELTWEQIEDKRSEYLRAAKAYDDNTAIMDRLLALRDLTSGAATVGEACDQLGILLEDYLGDAESSAA